MQKTQKFPKKQNLSTSQHYHSTKKVKKKEEAEIKAALE